MRQVQVGFVAAPNNEHGNQSVDLDESRVFDVRDLVTSAIEIHRGTELRTRDVIQFVVLCRAKQHPHDDIFTPNQAGRSQSSPRASWTVPDPQIFNDLINRAECLMSKRSLPCLKTQKWANMWGKVGLVGLCAKNPDNIRQYRNVIEQMEHRHLNFTIFPRDAVDKRGSVSVLLLEKFRAFDPLCLPELLFLRNKGLRGALKVTHIKTYQDDELSLIHI